MIITGLTILFVLAAGVSMTFAAVRLVQQHDQPSLLNSPDLVPPIVIVEADQKSEASSMEVALAKLDAMVGLAPVKQEVKGLVARMQAGRSRRHQGPESPGLGRQVGSPGPPG